MSEMVERVARALCTADGCDPDHEGEMTDEGSFLWQSYVKGARAAIAAMRDPTEEMIESGWQYTGDPCWQEDVAKCFNAMIDEALK